MTTSPRPPGRPRVGIDAEVFAATLRTVDEQGYSGATMDRIAASASVAKSTLYRRWPSKGVLITDCLIDAFGPLPSTEAAEPAAMMAAAIRWFAGKVAEPGVGAAFAGVFVDGYSDPSLREILASRLQEPYLRVLEAALRQPEQTVLLLIDITVGTMLHRMGITGAPMAEDDVEALIELVRRHFSG